MEHPPAKAEEAPAAVTPSAMIRAHRMNFRFKSLTALPTMGYHNARFRNWRDRSE